MVDVGLLVYFKNSNAKQQNFVYFVFYIEEYLRVKNLIRKEIGRLLRLTIWLGKNLMKIP
jgi:hypothetical protein